MQNKKIRIGFDLDGVILTNHIRVLRSLISRSKKAHLFPRQELEFYHPNSSVEDFLWLLVHKSSFKLANGFHELEQLALDQKIDIYVVSARFACLKNDTAQWRKIIDRRHVFKGMYFNDQDEQPHFFKKQMIEKLKLDYFVEDNWDVASYLANNQKQVQIWWLSNFFDRTINYPYKFFSFKDVVLKIQSFLI
ncbi:MAG TPA: hypothetical protein PLQ50_02175 [Candidatus Woesebacteria bacterium]|nr:hypothetical protein [Candidatus Woesebacteria bacterium]